jgi:hypothetical protein
MHIGFYMISPHKMVALIVRLNESSTGHNCWCGPRNEHARQKQPWHFGGFTMVVALVPHQYMHGTALSVDAASLL